MEPVIKRNQSLREVRKKYCICNHNIILLKWQRVTNYYVHWPVVTVPVYHVQYCPEVMSTCLGPVLSTHILYSMGFYSRVYPIAVLLLKIIYLPEGQNQ